MIHKYFHVSPRRLENPYLIPRVPQNKLTYDGREDNTIPRICVCQNISGCLVAGCTSYQEKKTFYLYSCEKESGLVAQPTIKQVYDAYFTGEEWILEPTLFQLETILHVTKEIINKEYSKYIVCDKRNGGFYRMEFISYDYQRVNKQNREKKKQGKKYQAKIDKFDVFDETNRAYIKYSSKG